MKSCFRLARRLTPKLLLTAVSLTLSVVLLELAIRWLMPIHDPSGHLHFVRQENDVVTAEPEFVGRHWKSTGDYDVHVRISRRGFRDAKDIANATENDIVVVGDSFSFGWGVEESERFSNLLESKLAIPVFNIAIPTDLEGYGRLVDYARSSGAAVRRIVVGICMENDLADYDRQGQRASQDIAARWRLSQALDSAKAYLSHNSAAYNALSSAVHRSAALSNVLVEVGIMRDSSLPLRANRARPSVISSSVERLSRLAREFDAVLVIIPSRGLWVGSHQETERQVHDEFVSQLTQHGLNVIDLRPFMEHAGDPMSYHFQNDGHWNSRGHKLAAELIAARIKSRRQ